MTVIKKLSNTERMALVFGFNELNRMAQQLKQATELHAAAREALQQVWNDLGLGEDFSIDHTYQINDDNELILNDAN